MLLNGEAEVFNTTGGTDQDDEATILLCKSETIEWTMKIDIQIQSREGSLTGQLHRGC